MRPKRSMSATGLLHFVLDAEQAMAPSTMLVHPAHGSNVLLDKTFVWGDVNQDFKDSPHKLSLRVKWAASSTVPIETFGVVTTWDPWREILDVYLLDPDAALCRPDRRRVENARSSSVRVDFDVDVGGSYGVKRGIKNTVLAGCTSPGAWAFQSV